MIKKHIKTLYHTLHTFPIPTLYHFTRLVSIPKQSFRYILPKKLEILKNDLELLQLKKKLNQDPNNIDLIKQYYRSLNRQHHYK